jgi:hypothetical protein
MPTTFLKNPVSVNVASTGVSFHVTGEPAAATSGAGTQPANTFTVEGTTGQGTTGTGVAAGAGANVSITAGTGGDAPSGSTTGAGGSVTINPGPPGAGGGTSALHGNVLLATAGGNVGIGTTNSDISGIGASVTTLTLFKGSGRGNLELATGNDANGAAVGTVTFTNSLQSTSAKRVAEIRSLVEGSTALNRGGRLTFGTRADGASDVSTRMIIDQAGKVALGPFTPAADLDMTKTESGGRTEIRISNLSNTANSRAFLDLHVAGAAAGSPVLNFGVTGVVSWAAGIDNADGQKFKINGTNSSSVNDNFAGTNALTMLVSGNVGMGTTSPTSRLHVNGGVQVGAPTGGDKGAGSINVSGDIYKNGTPLLAKLEKAYSQIDALTKRLDRLEKGTARKTAKTVKSGKPRKSTKARKSSKERR